MAQRTVAFCDGKYIGIETIYTIIEGRQVNIRGKVEELRKKSQNNELFCPCGCGANLILVAGDKNLREQHFRIKGGEANQKCNVPTEGRNSVNSKIVLKCWLDDKLSTTDIESRVPIHAVGDVDRKYEFSFLSREKKIALSYCYDRANLSDEKIDILEDNSSGIHIIYIVDSTNGGSNGQYPESLMRVQNKQGYCLLLSVDENDYSKAELKAVFYEQDIDGLWRESLFAKGLLKDFDIDTYGNVSYLNQGLEVMLEAAKVEFFAELEKKKIRHAEKEKRRIEETKRIQEEQKRLREERRKQQKEAERQYKLREEESARCKAKLEEKQREKEAQRQAEKRKREEDFRRNMGSNFLQQETPVWDSEGNRWFKCEFCGKIAMEDFGDAAIIRSVSIAENYGRNNKVIAFQSIFG